MRIAAAEPASVSSLRTRATDDEGDDQEEQDRQPIDGAGGVLAPERAEHQQRHRSDRKHHLRQDRQQSGKFGGVGHEQNLQSRRHACLLWSPQTRGPMQTCLYC
jgi:hypothetical protein